MKSWWWMWFVVLVWNGAEGRAESLKLVAGVTDYAYAPYIFPQEGIPGATGIMYDVFYQIMNKLDCVIDVQKMPRKRLDAMLEGGELDVVAYAKEWQNHPEKFLFTDPVLRVRDVIFYRKQEPLQFGKIEDLFGKTLGGVTGYHYPALEPHFSNGKIKRQDVIDELTSLEVLLKGRLDGVIAAQAVGQWWSRSRDWQGRLLHTEREVQGFDYRFMFISKWGDLIPRFNKELAALKASGAFKAIEDKYR